MNSIDYIMAAPVPSVTTIVRLNLYTTGDLIVSYEGLDLGVKELKSLFRYEKMRRAAVMKEMKRMANIVANRGGKKDPVFSKPVKVAGLRKTNPKEIPSE